ncbi:MAG TPA: hypothetical protein VK007_05895, partial [Acidimicrobiales bacterium]|nr:hypothetical protein [Acidimicrobiales bacterium]
MVGAGQLDELRPRDPAGDLATVLDRDHRVVHPVQDERGDRHGRQHLGDVDLPDELEQVAGGAGGGAQPLEAREQLGAAGLGGERRDQVRVEPAGAPPAQHPVEVP